MTCSVESQSLSPVIPVTDQCVHEQSGHGGRDRVQQHGLPPTKADLTAAAAERQICQQQRPTPSSRYGTIAQGVGRLTILDHILCGKDNALPLRRHLFWVMDLSFLHKISSAKTTICGLTECLICRHGIPHRIASDQGAHFTARETVTVGPRSWTPLALPCSPSS